MATEILIDALSVVVLDKNIRKFLKAKDPKCLEQCLKALRECGEVKATNVVAIYKELVRKDIVPNGMHCEDCGQRGTKRVCPYAAELRGDDTLHVLCDDCYYRRAQEI